MAVLLFAVGHFEVPTSNLVQICLIANKLRPFIDLRDGGHRHLGLYFQEI